MSLTQEHNFDKETQAMIVTFQISIEVPEPEDYSEIQMMKDDMRSILAEFEEVVAKKNYSLDDSDWEMDN